jgi:hypothetical protein
MEKRDVVDYIYLAISTTWSQFFLITDIIKNEKGKTCKMNLPY